MQARVYSSCAHVRARIFTKKISVITSYLLSKSIKFLKDPSFPWGDIPLFVTAYDIELKILSFSKTKKRHFVRQNLPPRICQTYYLIQYYALYTFYLINKKNCLKIRHLLASHEWVEWTRFEESHLHIFNGVTVLVNVSHLHYACFN